MSDEKTPRKIIKTVDDATSISVGGSLTPIPSRNGQNLYIIPDEDKQQEYVIDDMGNILFSGIDDQDTFYLVKKTKGGREVKHQGRPIYSLTTDRDSAKSPYRERRSPVSGSYGTVLRYGTQGIAVKKFDVLGDRKIKITVPQREGDDSPKELSSDFVRETAIYRTLDSIACLPKLIQTSFGFSRSIFMELGEYTLNENTWDYTQKKTEMLRLLKCFLIIYLQGIIHADLKPENIVIMKDKTLKIIDWGLAEINRFPHQNIEKDCTKQTFLYRAPEIQLYVMLNMKKGIYSSKIDVFSVGLILFELFFGKRLIQSEKDSNTRITDYIIDLLLIPEAEVEKRGLITSLEQVVVGKSHKDSIRSVIISMIPVRNVIREEYELLSDLIAGMIEPNPGYRTSWEDAIHHPFFQYSNVTLPNTPETFVNPMKILSRDTLVSYWTRHGFTLERRDRAISAIYVICAKNMFFPEIQCLSFQLLDLYVGTTEEKLTENDLIPLQITVIVIANKVFNDKNITVKDYVVICDEICSQNKNGSATCKSLCKIIDVIKQEVNVLRQFGGNVLIPTVFTYDMLLFSEYWSDIKGDITILEYYQELYKNPNIYEASLSTYSEQFGVLLVNLLG